MDESTELDETPRPRWDDDRGATLVEYVLMVGLIALVCIVALGYFQEEVRESFSTSASSVAQAGT